VCRSYVPRRSAFGIGGCASGGGGLVGVLQWDGSIDAAVGERARVREVFDVDFLSVALVEEDSSTRSWHIGEYCAGSDTGITDVFNGGLNFCAFDGGFRLAPWNSKMEEAIVKVCIRGGERMRERGVVVHPILVRLETGGESGAAEIVFSHFGEGTDIRHVPQTAIFDRSSGTSHRRTARACAGAGAGAGTGGSGCA
jgi:hypothetical protein